MGVISNRKIANATPLSYHGIKFKSKLEVMTYRTLREKGIRAHYEPQAFRIWEGFYPKEKCWSKNSTNNLVLAKDKVRDITYTPDFKFRYRGYTVYVESKGFETDTFKMKFKMFRKLMDNRKNVLIFEIFNKRMVLQMISLLDSLEMEERTIKKEKKNGRTDKRKKESH